MPAVAGPNEPSNGASAVLPPLSSVIACSAAALALSVLTPRDNPEGPEGGCNSSSGRRGNGDPMVGRPGIGGSICGTCAAGAWRLPPEPSMPIA